jgi:hypothetical protein
MTQSVTSPGVARPSSPQSRAEPSPALWRLAGALALGHVLLMLGAFALEGVASVGHGTAPGTVVHTYRAVSLNRTLGAGYVEALAFFVLTPAVILIGWLFARRTLLGRLSAQTFVAFGVAFVASTLAVGFPAGAAALYAAHHGVDAGSVAMVNDIRNYGFLLQVALTAGMALALGVAALAEGRHTRWIGVGGVVVGALGLVATPFAHDTVSMVGMIWWVGTAVVLLRQKTAHE